MIKVSIADDHPLMLEGIKRVLNREMGIEVLQTAVNGAEVMNMLSDQLPDILIMDITLPGKSGIEVIKDIREVYPDLPVLCLSIHPEERFAVRALKAGAQGYVHKSSVSDELVKAIKIVVNQKRNYISPVVAEQLALQVNNQGQPLHESLSDREFEVLCKIANGKPISEIAADLNLSAHTVHTYRSRIKKKMNLGSDVEITRYALLNNLVD